MHVVLLADWTALHLAASKLQHPPAIVAALLSREARCDLRNKDGQSC
jgi:hypothetical protein